MKILLTGATGFLGFRTLEKLIQLTTISSIVATGRNLRPDRTINDSKITFIIGNLEDEIFVNELVADVDCIINTAALSSPWGKSDAFIKANIITQKNLINAAQHAGVKRFIYISTPSLYCNGKDRFLVKESDPLPKKFVNEYARTKREAEILLENSTLPYLILRPRALIGRGDTIIMPRLIRAYNDGKLRQIGNGKNFVDLTSVENVVDAIILGLNAPNQALCQTYNITNGAPVNLWQNIRMVLQSLGKQLPQKKIPFVLINFIAGILELKSKLTDYSEPAITRYGVGTIAQSFTLDISKARNLLGYDPKVSTQQSMDEFVKWYSKT